MADDVTLNSMSGGSVVSTDQAGDGSHVQIVKLGYSADGSRTHVDADSSGLKVNVSNATITVALGSALPAGSNVIGAVTQSGTWNIGSITTLPSLPAGTNAIGGVTQSGSWNVGQSGTWTVDYSNQRSWGDSYSAGHKFVPVAAVNSSGNYAYLGVNAANGGLFVTPTANTTWTTIERGATIGHATASVTTSAAQIVASSTTRRTITVQNLGTDYVWLGATGISANNGLRLAPGQTAVIDRSPNAAVFAIASSGTQVCSIFTESD